MAPVAVVVVLAAAPRLSGLAPTMATWEPSAETARPVALALVSAPRVRVKATLPAESYLIRATSCAPWMAWPLIAPVTLAST